MRILCHITSCLFILVVQYCLVVKVDGFIKNNLSKRWRSNILKQKQIHNNNMSPLKTDNLKRGDSYGAVNNSTVLTAKEAADAVGVKPPEEASAKKWKRAWTIMKVATPILHLFDRQKPPNNSLNLYVLWWKALSGNDIDSPVWDDSLSFDLLPRGSRHIVKKFRRFFPRLHHANVEIRTAFLDRAVTDAAREHPDKKIRLISFGSGYDLRSIKLKERNVIDKAYELDLEEVVNAKKKLLTSKRFQRRRPHIVNNDILPTWYPVDLNDLDLVNTTLTKILTEKLDDDNDEWHTIFLFEAVMIYLNDGIPHSLLELTSNVLRNCNQSTGSLCFADRLENIPGGDEVIGKNELKSTGWYVIEWLPKPGLARHMGRANLIPSM